MVARLFSTVQSGAQRVRQPSVSTARRRPPSAHSSEPGPRISRTAIFVQTLSAQAQPIRQLWMGNLKTLLRGLCPPFRWGVWANQMKLPRRRCFWRRMIPVLLQVSNSSLTVVEGKSDRETMHRRPCTSLSVGMLEKICHRLQDFPRKSLIRYGAGQRHRSDERAESQDSSRSCPVLILAWEQPGKQLNIRLDLISGELTSPLVAASDFRGQCAEGAARTWIPAVHIAYIVVDKLLEGERPPAGCSSCLLALPDSECIAECLRYQFVTRVEVLVEATNRQAGFLHQLRNSESCKPFFTESL